MSVIGSNILAGASGQGGYFLTNSLRFRASATAYLNRTGGTATNAQKATYSFWFKRGALTTGQWIFTGGASGAVTLIGFNGSSDALSVLLTDVSGEGNITLAVFRDPSAWYHFVIAIDTTQATTADRAKIYVNGVLQTVTVANGGIGLNANWGFNTANTLNIGRYTGGSSYTDGYLAEVNFIDGQALTPSSFGQTSATTGVWQPIKYTGTYGTNGFYLDFEDTSSTAALGYDAAGSNDWTVNNISLTAGITYDSMTDVPTLTSATAANYCTLNPLAFFATGASAIDGNLTLSITTAGGNIKPTFGATTGKFYAEFTINNIGGATGTQFTVATASPSTSATSLMNAFYYVNGQTFDYVSASFVGYGASYTTGDIIGVAWDCDAFSVTFYKNNVSQGTLSGAAINANAAGQAVAPFTGSNGSPSSISVACNYGQRPFSYTPPSGFVALNTFNLPTPTIGATASSQANKYMNIALYTGTGSSQSITGLGFQPDWTWIKGRSGATDHGLYDAVRGVQKQLESNTTTAETTEATGLTAFGSDGFTVGALAQLNTSSATYVGWNWKANGAGSSNTAGTITSTVSANTTAGFSIVAYTGNGTNGATVGHGLGAKPFLIIEKGRTSTFNWSVQGCGELWTPVTSNLFLNATSGLNLNGAVAAPTSTVFTPSATNYANESGVTNIAYCFAPVAGYSAFGSYTGNGSTNGPFIYTGFRPRFIILKRTDAGADAWIMMDTSTQTYNVVGNFLQPSQADQELTTPICDFLSNGFKLRETYTAINSSGASYIYMAFAESPFKYANAR
jgi:hypothetical protein